MRADRLVAALLLMQARGRVTAAQLAEELEVSVATARRDLEALSAAGIPVYPQPGRGGGWSLLGEGRTDLSGFSAPEARALFLLLGPRAQGSAEARSALRKVLRALPATFRAEAEAAADAVVVDAARWGAGSDAGRPEGLETLERAVVERRLVRFAYTPWGGEPRPRRVAPLGLVEKAGVRYLLAEPAGEADAGAGDAGGGRPGIRDHRSYRVDRMSAIAAEEERFEPPPGFDLAAAWAASSVAALRRREAARAEVLVDAAAVEEFAGWTGARRRDAAAGAGSDAGGGPDAGAAPEADPDAGTRVPMLVVAPAEIVLVRRLAGWGDHVEVTGPPELRAALAAAGERLARRHAAPAPPTLDPHSARGLASD